MPVWLTTGLSIISDALGISRLIAAYLHDREQRQIGAAQNEQASVNVALTEDQDARRIEANNAGLDRAALLAKLHDQSSGGG